MAGYGITDGLTSSTAASTYAAKATTLAGYGITDGLTAATAASTYAAKATTLSGYGITDAYTKTATDTALAAKLTANAAITAGTGTKVTYDANGLVTSSTTLSATDIPSLDWAKITTGKPTTLAGYGITDAITAATAASTYAAKSTTLSGYGIVLTSANVTTALGYTPFNAANTLSGGTF